MNENDIRMAISFINNAKELLSPAWEERVDVEIAMSHLEQARLYTEDVLHNYLNENK